MVQFLELLWSPWLPTCYCASHYFHSIDGLTATRSLRQQGYTKPIIALSGNVMKEDEEASLTAGCSEHLAKPVTREMLLQSLSKHQGQAEKN